MNALHFASMKGRTEVIRWLLNAGLKVNAKMRNGSNALMLAARAGAPAAGAPAAPSRPLAAARLAGLASLRQAAAGSPNRCAHRSAPAPPPPGPPQATARRRSCCCRARRTPPPWTGGASRRRLRQRIPS